MTDARNKPRHARDAVNTVIYRKENEFCAWPFTSGFWETADGHLVAGFRRDKAFYGNSAAINHDSLSSASSFEVVTIRSEDRGRNWNADEASVVWNAAITNAPSSGATLADLAPIDFTDRNVLVSCYSVPRYGLPTDRAWVSRLEGCRPLMVAAAVAAFVRAIIARRNQFVDRSP